MAVLVPCLVALRDEFNRNFPRRDKASDGWIGDAAHSLSSDHTPDELSRILRDHDADDVNEVHAIDVDEDLKAPGVTMRDCVQEVVRRHRTGLDNRLTYVIYERTIYSPRQDWAPRTYAGANPHDKHAHFSASYVTSRENNRASFGVEDLVKEADIAEIVKRVTAAIPKQAAQATPPTADTIAKAVADYKVWNPYAKRDQALREIWGWTPSASWHQTTHGLLADLAELIADTDAANDTQTAAIHAKVAEIRELLADAPEPENPPA